MPTHHRGNPREVRALDAFVKLSRAVETIAARLAEGLAGSGVTPGQLGVLEALHHLGTMTQRALCAKLLRSDPNMSIVLGNLEAAGLVARARSRADKRAVEVSLTPAGRRLIARVFPPHARRIAALMGALTVEEQAELGRLCRKLGLAAAGAGGRAAAP